MESYQCYGIWVPKSDAKVFARYPEFEGLPDLDVSKVAQCAALSPRFGTALDIGAHVGAVAVYLSRKFERVVAFEAIPQTFEYLLRNTDTIDNVERLNVAIGPAAGETYFSHYAKHGQLSHVAGEADLDRTFRIGPVPVRTIDSFDYAELSFIKIDVEGYELQVLEGALATIERCRPLILVEQAGNEEKHFGRLRNEASALLESLGMRMHPGAPHMKNDRLYTF